MTIFRPKRDECAIIRQSAISICKGKKNVVIELGRRDDGNTTSTNWLLLEESHDLDDYMSMADFRNGTDPLTEDGRGLYDFYVSLKYGSEARGTYEQELEGNIYAHYEGGELVRVTDGEQSVWTKDGGYQKLKFFNPFSM